MAAHSASGLDTGPAHGTEAQDGNALARLWPGLLLTVLIAALAFAARSLPGLSVVSPMILAITAGIVFHNVIGTPRRATAGVRFAMRPILRFAIILLGLQLTAAQVVEVGASGVAVIIATVLCTFAFTRWLGTRLGVGQKLTELIAAGTSICGASAVIAVNAVTGAEDEDIAYAVACVTVFGSIAMFVYPMLSGLLGLDPHGFGLWSGSSIHEIAQVVAASYQDGQAAGEFGTIAKLTRVMMLAPVVLGLGLFATRRTRARGEGRAAAPMPWFVLGFIAMVGVNSLVSIPPDTKAIIATATTFLLSMALAAMGLETDIRKLRAKGVRPLLLGAGAFLFIASFSLLLVKATT